MKMQFSVSLFTCATCGASYNNRLKHTCVVPFSQVRHLSVGGSIPKNKKAKKRR